MEINYVCSLGSLCHSASILKRNNLRLVAYPFDWIFSNENIILDCLKNNFSVFLDKDNYINISINKCGHKLYHNSMFNHHNPLCKEDDYDYFKRCVNRFNELLKKDDKKLYMMINVNNLNKLISNDKIIYFNDEFKKYTSNYILLYIYHTYNNVQTSHEIEQINNIIILKFNSISKSSGTNFDPNKINDDNEYLDNVIKDIFKFNLNPIN
jgi:hypothetical protein